MINVDKIKLSKANKIISFMNVVDIKNHNVVVKASIYEDQQLVKEIKLKNFNKFSDFIEVAFLRGYQVEFIDILHKDSLELCFILESIIRLNKQIEQSDELYPTQDINDLLYEQVSFNNKLKEVLA